MIRRILGRKCLFCSPRQPIQMDPTNVMIWIAPSEKDTENAALEKRARNPRHQPMPASTRPARQQVAAVLSGMPVRCRGVHPPATSPRGRNVDSPPMPIDHSPALAGREHGVRRQHPTFSPTGRRRRSKHPAPLGLVAGIVDYPVTNRHATQNSGESGFGITGSAPAGSFSEAPPSWCKRSPP